MVLFNYFGEGGGDPLFARVPSSVLVNQVVDGNCINTILPN